MAENQRVISYVDGFNLYFGMKSQGWRRYYWLDVCKLSASLLLDNQQPVATKYFTARIASPPDKLKRQTLYVEAIQEATDAEILFGQYAMNNFRCPICKQTDKDPTEEMTDVNIATEMLTDAFQDRLDTALLISADSDLNAPVRAIRRIFPLTRVVVAFSPGRHSETLKSSSSAHISIHKQKLRQNQLP
jgi:uncharacterized LabA/DUF88 family protein